MRGLIGLIPLRGAENSANRGWLNLYRAKASAAKVTEQHRLATLHEERVRLGIDKEIAEAAKTYEKISGSELIQATGLQFSTPQKVSLQDRCAADITVIRTAIRRGIELTEGPTNVRLFGFMLIGWFQPWNQLYGKRSRGWLCWQCFRHSKEGTRSCNKHSTQAAILKEYRTKSRVRSLLGNGQYLLSREYKTYSTVYDIAYDKEWMRDIGIYQPQPPSNWQEYVTEWRNTYPWLHTTLPKEETWSGITKALRILLQDAYSISEDFELWEAKIHARGAELEVSKVIPTVDKRRLKRSSLPHDIAVLAKGGLTQTQIAACLGVSRSAVSQWVKDMPELQSLRRTGGRIFGVNIELS